MINIKKAIDDMDVCLNNTIKAERCNKCYIAFHSDTHGHPADCDAVFLDIVKHYMNKETLTIVYMWEHESKPCPECDIVQRHGCNFCNTCGKPLKWIHKSEVKK